MALARGDSARKLAREHGTRDWHSMNIRDIPWRFVRRTGYEMREHFFAREKPDSPSVMVAHSVQEVSGRLGVEFLNPKWPLSYHYYGEDYNARRYFYDESKEYPHRQLHIRGFEKENGKLELIAHTEPAPEHHPKIHLSNEEVNWEKGTFGLKKLLQNAGLDYEGS